MNYQHFSLEDAALREIVKTFIKGLKSMNRDLVEKRLVSLAQSMGTGADFLTIASQFNSLVGHETCVDDT